MRTGKKKKQIRRGSPELPFPKCVYCNIRDGIEREHVIASCFYAKPFPGDLPKVHACKQCNSGRGDGGDRDISEDECYMRDRMLLQMNIDEHPDAKELIDGKVMRSLSRPEAWREKKDLTDSLDIGCVELEQNVYLHDVASFKIDLSRFSRVMKKMVRGLFAYHLHEPMPEEYGLVTLPRVDMESFNFLKGWIEASNPSPLMNPGNRFNFCYRFGSGSKHPLGNNWLFVFYNRYSFCVHAGPKCDIPPEVELRDGMAGIPFPVDLKFNFE